MKKVLSFLIIFIVFFIPINVYADDASVNIEVVGKVEKGSTIEILVNLKGVEKFYAASVDFTYDTSQLKVESIVASEFITKHSNDIMELGGETDKNGNTASYSFTFLGDSNGISGSGTLVKITANVLNNEKLYINQENTKIKLVHRVGDTVENYSYSFSGYDTDDKRDEASDSENSSNNISNSNNNSENIPSDNDAENSNESNTSKEEASNIDAKDNNLNNNDEEIAKEDTEKEQNQTIDNKNGSDNEVLKNNKDNQKESNSSSKSIIYLIITLVIFIVSSIGYYLYKLKKKL